MRAIPIDAPGRSHRRFFFNARQYEVKFATLPGPAADANAAAVGHHDLARNGESQTGAHAGLAGRPEKALKDAGLIYLGNTGALVSDAELNAVAVGPGRAHLDFGAGRRMTQG